MAFHSSKPGFTQPMADINTTPLVDVMLVLLVIFIITAPLFQQAIPVNVPDAASQALEDQPQAIHVAIDAQGHVFVDNQAVAKEQLAARFASRKTAADIAPELHLRADRGTRYEQVTEVMAAAQAQGITKIAFVTQAAQAVQPFYGRINGGG